MAQKLPFYRTFRPNKNGGYSSWVYIRDKRYARDPQHFIRAYLLIQKDLVQLFEYVEPSEASVAAYSYRIHELLMRTCIEVEANFKAILSANGYKQEGRRRLGMMDYRKVNKSHHLSAYEVSLPIWAGAPRSFRPFEVWGSAPTSACKMKSALFWYDAYNASKHDRHEAFKAANLEALITAVSGLLVLLTSQFRTEDFSAGSDALAADGDDYYEFEPAIGSLFRVKYPDDWAEAELYDFDWSALSGKEERFAQFNHNALES